MYLLPKLAIISIMYVGIISIFTLRSHNTNKGSPLETSFEVQVHKRKIGKKSVDASTNNFKKQGC